MNTRSENNTNASDDGRRSLIETFNQKRVRVAYFFHLSTNVHTREKNAVVYINMIPSRLAKAVGGKILLKLYTDTAALQDRLNIQSSL
jgi:hypothetical protein